MRAPVRQRFQHKRLLERGYALEKILSKLEQEGMSGS